MEQRDNPYGYEDCGHETSPERPHLSVTGQPMASQNFSLMPFSLAGKSSFLRFQSQLNLMGKCFRFDFFFFCDLGFDFAGS